MGTVLRAVEKALVLDHAAVLGILVWTRGWVAPWRRGGVGVITPRSRGGLSSVARVSSSYEQGYMRRVK